MGGYLHEIWRCRYFWLSLVRTDLRRRYRRTLLGMGWSLLHPIALAVIFCTMFHYVFHKGDVLHYGAYVLAGLACWQFLVGSTLQGCQCFFQGESYIRQHSLPVAIYPLRTTLGVMFHSVVALSVVLIFVWYLDGFGNLPALLSLVPTFVILFAWGWAMGVLGGFANVHFQDVQHLAEVTFQLMFYATPIMYTAEFLRENDLDWVLDNNPAAPFLELVRQPILEGRVPSPETFATAGTMVFLLAAAAVGVLSRLQKRLIFYL